MKRKGSAARFTAAILLALTLVGCSGEAHIISYESGEVTAAAQNSPKIAAEDIKAKLLLPDTANDGGCMSEAHADAFEAAAKELGIVSYTAYGVVPEDSADATKDANVIFGSCYEYMNPLDKASRDNPDKLYACFGGYKYNSTNYSNYYTAIYEAQFLAGIAAGTNSDKGKIGIISEYSSEYPDSAAEINSFAIGAKTANSEVQILVRSLGSRSDTSKAKDYTEELISKGCDVISIQCNTSAPAEAAAAKDVMFIGYGTDMSGENCLTSVVWNLKDYYKSALTAATDGSWAAGNYYGNLADGAVTISPLSEDAGPETQPRIDSATELLKGELLEIFSNRKVMFDTAGKATVSNSALTDNKGNVMISEDGTAYFIYSGDDLKSVEPSTVTSDKLASTVMNYLVDCVTVIE